MVNVIIALSLVVVILVAAVVVINSKLKKTNEALLSAKARGNLYYGKYTNVKQAIADTIVAYKGKGVYVAGMKKITAAIKDL